MILSFAQKVLTQDHWDTKKALDIMQIVPPLKTELEVINKNEMYCEEQVCFFKEFRSSRMKIYSDKCIQFEAMESYRILFNVNGELSISVNASNFIEVKQGACIFIPPNIVFELKSQADSTILFCLPN